MSAMTLSTSLQLDSFKTWAQNRSGKPFCNFGAQSTQDFRTESLRTNVHLFCINSLRSGNFVSSRYIKLALRHTPAWNLWNLPPASSSNIQRAINFELNRSERDNSWHVREINERHSWSRGSVSISPSAWIISPAPSTWTFQHSSTGPRRACKSSKHGCRGEGNPTQMANCHFKELFNIECRTKPTPSSNHVTSTRSEGESSSQPNWWMVRTIFCFTHR